MRREGGACGFVQRPTAGAASSAARGAIAGVEPDGSCHPGHTVVAIVSILDGSAGVQRPTFSSTAARSGRPTRRARDADRVHRTSLAAELRGRCAGNGDLPRQTPSWPWRTCTRPGRGRFRISRRARTYAAEQSRARGGEGPPADCAGTGGAWRRHHHDPLWRQVIIAAPDLPIGISVQGTFTNAAVRGHREQLEAIEDDRLREILDRLTAIESSLAALQRDGADGGVPLADVDARRGSAG